MFIEDKYYFLEKPCVIKVLYFLPSKKFFLKNYFFPRKKFPIKLLYYFIETLYFINFSGVYIS